MVLAQAGRAARIDPVCGMPVPAGTQAGLLVHAGQSFAFCSFACAGGFAADPETWVG